MKLNNKRILITGANRGIGLAMATELAKRPVHLILGMRDPGKFEFDQNRAASVELLSMDLSNAGKTQKSIKNLGAREIDILINNAGQYLGGDFVKQDPDDIEQMLNVNLFSAIILTQAVLPGMLKRRSGYIVNNASISGYAFYPGSTTYSASKAGLVGFSESLRRELYGSGVGVMHLVTPGVDTQMLDEVEDVYARSGNAISLSRVSPEQWARKVVRAIEQNRSVLNPGGVERLAKLASRGPAFLLDRAARRIKKKKPAR